MLLRQSSRIADGVVMALDEHSPRPVVASDHPDECRRRIRPGAVPNDIETGAPGQLRHVGDDTLQLVLCERGPVGRCRGEAHAMDEMWRLACHRRARLSITADIANVPSCTTGADRFESSPAQGPHHQLPSARLLVPISREVSGSTRTLAPQLGRTAGSHVWVGPGAQRR